MYLINDSDVPNWLYEVKVNDLILYAINDGSNRWGIGIVNYIDLNEGSVVVDGFAGFHRFHKNYIPKDSLYGLIQYTNGNIEEFVRRSKVYQLMNTNWNSLPASIIEEIVNLLSWPN